MNITGSVLFVMLVLLPEILALTLLFLLVRCCFSSARTSPGLWVCGAQVALSAFLLVTSWRMLPGPAISISADIFPAVGSMVLLAVAARGFKRSPMADRIGLTVASFASVGVIALVVFDVMPFWSGRFACGALVGW